MLVELLTGRAQRSSVRDHSDDMGRSAGNDTVSELDVMLPGVEKISEINEKLANGDNVVLLANHQSEADPQIFSV